MGNVSAVDIGIDVGSTTTKICALDALSRNLLHTSYERHGARQAESVRAALNSLARLFPRASIRLALTGSGAAPIADKLGVPFVQEVVANACAVQALYPRTRCAIELGGQDAKMIFFRANETTGALDVADMRMNGSCAGGTGAFIDEIASVLNLPIEQFDAAACRGRTVYDISGRCGVYAKTDIQPLLNQGASRDDLALSAFHAIAKQTLGGLAQGIDVCPPIIFEGGPLTFNPTLISVFKERLNLADDQAIVPDHPETMVARGAALSLSSMFADAPATIDPAAAAQTLVGFTSADDDHAPGKPFFETAAERKAFARRNQLPEEPHGPESAAAKAHMRNGRLRVWLGIDSGSTTTKLALVADDGQLIDSFYANNEGDPLEVARRALVRLRDRYAAAGITLDIAGVGTTGYGELLFNRALHADYHT
ncbi:MAG: BadF/BadG/BcrA/BcrD ATPase family protein, partial [Senegalimassilia anaerobia]